MIILSQRLNQLNGLLIRLIIINPSIEQVYYICSANCIYDGNIIIITLLYLYDHHDSFISIYIDIYHHRHHHHHHFYKYQYYYHVHHLYYHHHHHFSYHHYYYSNFTSPIIIIGLSHLPEFIYHLPHFKFQHAIAVLSDRSSFIDTFGQVSHKLYGGNLRNILFVNLRIFR